MQKDDCYYIGYLSKAIGHNGEVALRLDVDDPAMYQDLSFILLQINKRDQELVPFSLHKTLLQEKAMMRIKMEGVDDAASAKQLVGSSVFLPLEALPPLSGNKFYYHEVIGFDVSDEQHGSVGKITEVLEYPHQSIFQILHKSGKEVLIPINDETILQVDRTNKVISIATPAGLIDLYLEE